jgi:hypothetical protein
MFGSPVPGYAAPEGGPTVEANSRIGQVFVRLGVEMWAAGEMQVTESSNPPVGTRGIELLSRIHEQAPGFPAPGLARLMGAWAAWHGMVMLEITHHLEWMYPDALPFFETELDRILS